MARLIDADALIKSTDKESVHMWQIALAPTVDAVEVVRCKKCKYSRPKKSGIKLHCAWWYRSVEDEDYCSRGKRRET